MLRLRPLWFPICAFQTCTNGQVFPQEVQRSPDKCKPSIWSQLTIVFLYSYDESKWNAWVLGDSFSPQNVPSVP
jgi:hypothetical protein